MSLKYSEEEEEMNALIEAEHVQSGRQTFSLFYNYVKSFGLPLFVVYAILLCVCATTTMSIANIYIANWVSETEQGTGSLGKLEIFGALGVGSSEFYFG